jgi:hypothetical protein
MKKITFALLAVITFAFSFSAKAQCDYSIVLTDSWGDGWNGVSTMDVLVDGVVVLDDIEVSDLSGTTDTFALPGLTDGQIITTAFNPLATGGGPDWGQECSYEIFNANGVVVYSSGNLTDPVHNGPRDVVVGDNLAVNCAVCTPPAATLVGLDTFDCGAGVFSFIVNVSDLGGATSVEITNTAGVASTTVTATGDVTLTGFPTDTVFDITLVDDEDTSCNVTIAGIQFVCPPANDLCGAGATALTPGAIFDTNAIGGQTQVGATDSGELPLPSCSTYDPIDATGLGGDIWYSVVVPGDGNITIETQGDPFGNGGDTGMSVYSGACGALVEVACDDDLSDDGFYSLVAIADPTLAGQTLYIRVFEFGGNNVLSFQISAYSATLSTESFENENAFTYFPNPVRNELTLNAQKDIENVAIYNMLGQEVLRTQPNTINSVIDMNGFSQGAYFVQVTIGNVTETIRVIKQ